MTTRIPPEEYTKFNEELVITESLLKKYHSDAEVARFQKWSRNITLIMTVEGICYRPTDYNNWIRLGMPDANG